MNDDFKKTSKLGWGILFILCIFSLFLFLGETLFNTRGEPREAIVAYSMLEHGNWILPVNNGDEIAFKPPLLHWAIATLSSITGSISEYTSRIPSALSVMVMVLVGFVFYSKRRNSEVGLLMGILTLTTFEVHRAAYACRVDMLLSALTVMALYALYRWAVEQDMKGFPWLGWVFMAGAALTKGPVGVVLPCGAIAVYLLLRGHNFFQLLWRFALIAIASILPLLIWYWAAYNEPHGGDRFLQLIYEENVLRFTGGMTYASHVNPWPYNVMTIIAGFVPYTLIVVMALPFCWKYMKKWFTMPTMKSLVTLKTFKQMDDLSLFSLVSFLVIFIFYCIPMSKRSVYLLPVYPFLAYFLAEFILWLRKEHLGVLKVFGHIFAVAALLLTGVFFAVRMGWIPEEIFSGKHAAENTAYLHALHTAPLGFLSLIVIILPVIAAMYFWANMKKPDAERSRWLMPYRTTMLIFTLFLALDGFYQPTVLNTKSDKSIAKEIEEIVPEGTVYSYRAEYYEANRMHPFTINFYMNDRVIPIDKAPETPQNGYLIVSGESMTKFVKEYPQYDAQLIFKTDRRSCDDRQPVSLYKFQLKK